MNTKIIKLDINRRLYDKIVAKQDDTGSRFLLFQLLDGAVPFNLTDRSVRVYGVKPDGAVIFNDLTVTHSATGFCLLELTNQMLAIAGTVKLELMITEGDKKLTSIPFEMEVIKKINSNDAVESSNEFRALLNALKEIDDWNKEFADKSGKLEELYTPRLNELGSQLETIVSSNGLCSTNENSNLITSEELLKYNRVETLYIYHEDLTKGIRIPFVTRNNVPLTKQDIKIVNRQTQELLDESCYTLNINDCYTNLTFSGYPLNAYGVYVVATGDIFNNHTTKDTLNLQLLIDEVCNKDGGAINLSSGTYNISSSLFVSNKNVKLIGQQNTVLKAITDLSSILYVYSKGFYGCDLYPQEVINEGFVINNIKINCFNKSYDGIYFNGCSRMEVDNVNVYNAINSAIKLNCLSIFNKFANVFTEYCKNGIEACFGLCQTSFDSCRFARSTGNGVYVSGFKYHCYSLTFTNCAFEFNGNMDNTVYASGFHGYGSLNNINFIGCYFENNGSAHTHNESGFDWNDNACGGIKFDSSSYYNIRSVVVKGCYFSSNLCDIYARKSTVYVSDSVFECNKRHENRLVKDWDDVTRFSIRGRDSNFIYLTNSEFIGDFSTIIPTVGGKYDFSDIRIKSDTLKKPMIHLSNSVEIQLYNQYTTDMTYEGEINSYIGSILENKRIKVRKDGLYSVSVRVVSNLNNLQLYLVRNTLTNVVSTLVPVSDGTNYIYSVTETINISSSDEIRVYCKATGVDGGKILANNCDITIIEI